MYAISIGSISMENPDIYNSQYVLLTWNISSVVSTQKFPKQNNTQKKL